MRQDSNSTRLLIELWPIVTTTPSTTAPNSTTAPLSWDFLVRAHQAGATVAAALSIEPSRPPSRRRTHPIRCQGLTEPKRSRAISGTGADGTDPREP